MPQLVYVGPEPGPVEVIGLSTDVIPGEPVDVPKEFAGRAPTGEPGDENYDPGEGLLAQPTNWKPAKAAKKKERDA